MFCTKRLIIADVDTEISIDVLTDLARRVIGFLFEFGLDNIGDEVRICSDVLETDAGTVFVLIDEDFDDKTRLVISTSIYAPSTTLVLASHVELGLATTLNIGGEPLGYRVKANLMFQRVCRVSFRAGLELWRHMDGCHVVDDDLGGKGGPLRGCTWT